MTTKPPQSSILAGIVPEFPVGTVVEIKNNVDTIPLEDRIGIVREYSLFSNSEKQYIAYNVELVSKPGVFRSRTKQFLKAANMPTKQPVPPPKFNIRDEVIYKQLRYKVTNRRYIASNWVYSIELNEPSSSNLILALPSAEIKESALELAPPSKLDPMQFPVTPRPEPKYKQGNLVWFKNCGREIQTSHYDQEKLEYEYKISVYPGGPEYDSLIRESELEPYNNPPTPQEPTTVVNEQNGYFDEIDGEWIDEPNPFNDRKNKIVVNEQGGKQSHLDARFDCIPSVVLRLLAQCLGFGARKYGKENWKKIPQWDHLNHAMNHINEWNRGNRDEPHLVNAMARLTFALWQAVDNNTQPDTYLHPDDTK